MLLHDRQMHRIPRRYLPVAHHNLFSAFRRAPVNSQYLIGNAQQSVERRLDGIPPIYGDITMQNFLQDFGVGNQALPVANQIFEQPLRVGLVRMRRTNEIHGNIGVDQNQECVPAPYPLSISASIVSISPEG